MQLEPVLIMRERRIQLVSSVDTTAIGDHHHLLATRPKDAHHLMDILAVFMGIKMGHDLVDNPRGAIRHRADDVKQYPTTDATPAAMLLPGLAFETLLRVDLVSTQGMQG